MFKSNKKFKLYKKNKIKKTKFNIKKNIQFVFI